MRIHDEKVMAALSRLSTDSDFQLIMEKLFKKEYDTAIDSCIREENPGRYQGKAEFLKDFISSVDKIRDTYRLRNAHDLNMSKSL